MALDVCFKRGTEFSVQTKKISPDICLWDVRSPKLEQYHNLNASELKCRIAHRKKN